MFDDEGKDELARPSIEALNAYCKVHPREVGEKEVIGNLFDESDRAAIIVAASLLEEALTDAMLGRLRKMSVTQRKKIDLFEHHGLVSGFGQKIDMAYALEVIDGPMWTALDHIRIIRNNCAHAFRPLKLDPGSALRAACEMIFHSDWKPIVSEALGQLPANFKHAFIMELMAMSVAIEHGRPHALKFIQDVIAGRD